MVAAAAPPASMIEGMDRIGFDLTHVYGLTETYGPATVCAKQPEWAALDVGERAMKNSRQGVRSTLEEAVAVLDPESMQPVPSDGETIGEIMFRGNIMMKGYLKNDAATDEAFRGGWFHTGDLAVVQPDGYLRIKDRSKDIIISGGENISSIEVEDALYRHPEVVAAAVVAQPDPRWGEVPCAFVELKEGAQLTEQELQQHCRKHLAGFKMPKRIVFGDAAENINRQDPEVLVASAGEIDSGDRRVGVQMNAPVAEQYVLTTRDERGVATLTLNRPQQFNALSQEMMAALQTEFESLADRRVGARRRNRRAGQSVLPGPRPEADEGQSCARVLPGTVRAMHETDDDDSALARAGDRACARHRDRSRLPVGRDVRPRRRIGRLRSLRCPASTSACFARRLALR